jgi:hypothetical protein
VAAGQFRGPAPSPPIAHRSLSIRFTALQSSERYLLADIVVYMNTTDTPLNIDNRARMRELCALAGSQAEAANLIAKHTRRPCSVNAVKSWTCAADSTRARTCHQWAIDALEKQLKKRGRIA